MEIVTKDSELSHFAKLVLCGIATPADMAFMRAEDLAAVKSDGGVMHYKVVTQPSMKAASESGRARKFLASDETPDRMGDIIRVRGWNLANFKRNPIALWAHDDRQPAIGSVVDIEKDAAAGKLFETIEFASAQANPLSESLFRLYEEGVLRAVSVGFVPIESYYPSDSAEREKIGLGQWGVEYRKQEQLELSCCNIPANPGCLSAKDMAGAIARLAGDGKIDRHAAKELAGQLGASMRTVFAVRSVSVPAAQADEPPASGPTIEERVAALEAKQAEIDERIKSLAAPSLKNSEPSAGDASPASDGTSREKDAGFFFEHALAAWGGRTNS